MQFTGNEDFVRFVQRGTSPRWQSVEGYYGLKADPNDIPNSGVWRFNVSSRSAVAFGGLVYSSGELSTRMSVDWGTETVFGRDGQPPLPGVGLFLGSVVRDDSKIRGRYVTIPYPESGDGFIRDTARGNTSLQIYGSRTSAELPSALGGIFSAYWIEDGQRSYAHMLMAGFFDPAIPPGVLIFSEGATLNGFATGHVFDPGTGMWTLAMNNNPDAVEMTFDRDRGSFEAEISVEDDDGGTYALSMDHEDSAFVGEDAFGALKEVNGLPAHIAAASNISNKYDYLSWGSWNKKTGPSQWADRVPPGSSWVVGQITPGHDIPTMGSGTYTGDVMGRLHTASGSTGIHGDLSLTANFGSRSLSGSFSNFSRANGGTWKRHGLPVTLTVNGSWASEANAIHGSITGAAGALAGKMNGAFFGPNAEEVGGNWRVSGSDVKAGGVFAGHQ